MKKMSYQQHLRHNVDLPQKLSDFPFFSIKQIIIVLGYSKALTMEMNSPNPSTLKYSLYLEHSYKTETICA